MNPLFAARMEAMAPFHVMALLQRARELERQGREIVHMEIGEPDFPTPPSVVDAAVSALRAGHTGYTPATGLAELREAIAGGGACGAVLDPGRVAVTPGASGALLLTLGVVVNRDDEILMADPGYPCNRNFVRMFEGRVVAVPVGPDTRYQLTAETVDAHWGPRTRAVLIASPSNPTGTALELAELARIADCVAARGGVLIVDEIYRRLSYAGALPSVLEHTDQAFVVNSFSKYYGMTGWRIGWLVVPEAYVDAVERLAQNAFLAPSTPGQYAALAALTPSLQPELERRREVFAARRDFLVPALREIGFAVDVEPTGAFYVYAECSRFSEDSFGFCYRLLEEAGVAVTPGRDFGDHRAAQHIRFSYANDLAALRVGMDRLSKYLRS